MESHLGRMLENMKSLNLSLHSCNDFKLEGLLLRGSLRYTGGKLSGSERGNKLENTSGKVFGSILGYVFGFTLAINIGT